MNQTRQQVIAYLNKACYRVVSTPLQNCMSKYDHFEFLPYLFANSFVLFQTKPCLKKKFRNLDDNLQKKRMKTI